MATFVLQTYLFDRHAVAVNTPVPGKTPFAKPEYSGPYPETLRSLNPDGPISIREFPQPYPSRRLYVALKNVDVEEIELRALQTDEIPDALRHPERLTSELGKPGESN